MSSKRVSLGRIWEPFCLGLCNNADETYIDSIAFYLCAGEFAPFSSVEEVYKLSPSRRAMFVKTLSNLYQKQKEEMSKNNG